MIVSIKCDACGKELQNIESFYVINEYGEYAVEVVLDYESFDKNVEVDTRNSHLATYKCHYCKKEHKIITRSQEIEEA